jgi:hypothetical protein
MQTVLRAEIKARQRGREEALEELELRGAGSHSVSGGGG